MCWKICIIKKSIRSFIKELKENTSNWNNIDTYSYTLDYGFRTDYAGNPISGIYSGEYVQNVRARLLTYEEAMSNELKDKKFLHNNISDDTNGYWLSTSDGNTYDIENIGWFHDAKYGVINDSIFGALNDAFGIDKLGIRPVITINK